MYSMGAYFLEIVPQPIPNHGWTGDAWFSRRSDYRKHADVPKVSFASHVAPPSAASAEAEIAAWARDFVATSSEVVESSLRLAEGA